MNGIWIPFICGGYGLFMFALGYYAGIAQERKKNNRETVSIPVMGKLESLPVIENVEVTGEVKGKKIVTMETWIDHNLCFLAFPDYGFQIDLTRCKEHRKELDGETK